MVQSSSRRPKRPVPTTLRHGVGRLEEWVGGRVSLPVHVVAEDNPVRPDLAAWMDVTNHLVVAAEVVEPTAPPEVIVQLLLRSFQKPMAGDPRRPKRIRIADPVLAELIRKEVDNIDVKVAMTPELDALIADFSQSMRRDKDERSCLEDGRVTPETTALFFRAAAKLYRVAPWRHVCDSQLLWLDSADLDARGRCVSVIGNAGQSFGVLIFENLQSFRAMSRRAESMLAGHRHKTIGASIFAINFDPGSAIPQTMRREIAHHGWEVADERGYPHIQWVDPDRVLRPLTDRNVVYAAACCEALAGFFAKHGEAIANETFTAARERFVLSDLPQGPAVEVAFPHPEGVRSPDR